jgi:hypothetical protein
VAEIRDEDGVLIRIECDYPGCSNWAVLVSGTHGWMQEGMYYGPGHPVDRDFYCPACWAKKLNAPIVG